MATVQLIICILLCSAAGVIGLLTSPTGNSPWYQQLIKPSFNPPPWVFAPVWTLLYCLMGISLFLLFRSGQFSARSAIAMFVVQLLINACWTPIFFRYHQLGLSFAWILLLWVAIVATIATAWPISRGAALLLLPYLLWVTFAGILNGVIWRLNAQAA